MTDNLKTAWQTYHNRMPDGGNAPNKAIACYDSGGRTDGRTPAGDYVVHDGVIVRVRARAFGDAWERMERIAKRLSQLPYDYSITYDSQNYCLDNVSIVSTPALLGYEGKGSRRRVMVEASFLVSVCAVTRVATANPSLPTLTTVQVSPAMRIAQFLLDRNVAESPDNVGTAFQVYYNHMPDGGNAPDNIITVYDTPGSKDGRLMAGTEIQHPGIQVMVRARTHLQAWNRAAIIATELVRLSYATSVTVDSNPYTINQRFSSLSISFARWWKWEEKNGLRFRPISWSPFRRRRWQESTTDIPLLLLLLTTATCKCGRRKSNPLVSPLAAPTTRRQCRTVFGGLCPPSSC